MSWMDNLGDSQSCLLLALESAGGALELVVEKRVKGHGPHPAGFREPVRELIRHGFGEVEAQAPQILCFFFRIEEVVAIPIVMDAIGFKEVAAGSGRLAQEVPFFLATAAIRASGRHRTLGVGAQGAPKNQIAHSLRLRAPPGPWRALKSRKGGHTCGGQGASSCPPNHVHSGHTCPRAP